MAGLFLLIIVFFVIALAALWYPKAAKIIWCAFLVRLSFVLFHIYVAPLPGSTADMVRFELRAYELTGNGITGLISQFPTDSSYVISWFIALLYLLFERGDLIAQLPSVVMGTGTVLIGWVLARDIWGPSAASNAGWILALFPTQVLYSALVLREAYVAFFIGLALLGILRFLKTSSLWGLLLATFGFMGATLFHGAMFIGLLAFACIVFVSAVQHLILGLNRLRVKPSLFLSLALAFLCLAGFVLGWISVPKLGDFSNISDYDVMMDVVFNSTRSSDGGEAGASYPSWTIPQSPIELLTKGPVRILYFAFAPFPWDLMRVSHLIGMFDGIFYGFLFYYLVKNWSKIWAHPVLRVFIVILLSYYAVFGISIGNFGTGLRHRSKFILIIVTLTAPYLPKLRFFRYYN
jgi:hypothetical protein